jgi:hypothetical protein
MANDILTKSTVREVKAAATRHLRRLGLARA